MPEVSEFGNRGRELFMRQLVLIAQFIVLESQDVKSIKPIIPQDELYPWWTLRPFQEKRKLHSLDFFQFLDRQFLVLCEPLLVGDVGKYQGDNCREDQQCLEAELGP